VDMELPACRKLYAMTREQIAILENNIAERVKLQMYLARDRHKMTRCQARTIKNRIAELDEIRKKMFGE
jgi:hypothetical protein